MRVLLNLCLGLVLALIAAGQMGRWHPAGDSLAVLQVPLVLAGLAGVTLVRWPRGLRTAVTLGLVGLIALRVMDWTMPGPAGGDLSIYQKNLLFRGVDQPAFLAEIAATSPDVLTLQEVSARNVSLLSALRNEFPTQHTCPFAAVGETAVLSRFPMVPGSALCVNGLAALQVEAPIGAVWVVSVHLHWPWPYRQASHSRDLLAQIAALPGPVVVGGDFNMVPWSYHVRAFARAARGRIVRPVGATIWKARMPLPIDHVIAPCGGQRDRRPRLGSDHNGVLARVGVVCD